MEKVLVLVLDTHTDEDWVELCVKMLLCFKPVIHILSLVDRSAVTRIASNEGIRDTEIRERLLHEAYIHLYHLEDLFGKESLQVAIAAKEMMLPEELLVEIRKTNPGMLVIIGEIESHILESLCGSLHIPILLLPHEE